MEAALVKKFEDALEKDPSSRIFAQLGELYRKMGMIDRALSLYREGIKRHPAYNLGYLGLAFCYADLEQYQLAYATLRPLIETSRENIRLQRLFAHCCEKLSYGEEALETWKYLLFINPRDPESMAKVAALESAPVNDNVAKQSQVKFELEQIHPSPIDDDDIDEWVRVDLDRNDEAHIPRSSLRPDGGGLESRIVEDIKAEEAPLMSLTLVDLYIAQGHTEKAQEVLLKMLELNPTEQKIIDRLKEIATVHEEGVQSEASEEDGHNKLLRMVEEKQGILTEELDSKEINTTTLLDSFLRQIKQRAEEKST